MKVVSLNLEEADMTSAIGARRWNNVLVNRKNNPKYSPGELGDGYAKYCISAMGEYVVAREFGLQWRAGVEVDRDGDIVGPGGFVVEARTRRYSEHPGFSDMGLRQTDLEKNRPFVLVLAEKLSHRFKIVGWHYANDGWAVGKPFKTGEIRYVPPRVPPLRHLDELHAIIMEKAA